MNKQGNRQCSHSNTTDGQMPQVFPASSAGSALKHTHQEKDKANLDAGISTPSPLYSLTKKIT